MFRALVGLLAWALFWTGCYLVWRYWDSLLALSVVIVALTCLLTWAGIGLYNMFRKEDE